MKEIEFIIDYQKIPDMFYVIEGEDRLIARLVVMSDY